MPKIHITKQAFGVALALSAGATIYGDTGQWNGHWFWLAHDKEHYKQYDMSSLQGGYMCYETSDAPRSCFQT